MTHEEIDAIVASPHAYEKDIKFARALYELAGGFFPEEHILCAVRLWLPQARFQSCLPRRPCYGARLRLQ